MRESGLHRIAQYVRKNFIHSRRPIHTTAQHLFRIQASNIKPSENAVTEPPQQPTTIQASILERFPDRRKLSKLLDSLGKKARGFPTYFPVTQIWLAKHDLGLEEPVVRAAVLASKDVPNIAKILLYASVRGDCILGQEGYLDAVFWGDRKAEELKNNKDTDLSEIILLPAQPDSYALNIFLGSLESNGDTPVYPLVPLGETRVGAGVLPYPVHYAFVIHNDGDIRSKLILDNPMENALVKTIRDVPVEVLEKSSMENAQKLQISTEYVELAFELAREKSPDRHRIANLWSKSRLPDLLPLVVSTSKKMDMGVDQIPAHVRDVIATLLSNEIPDTLPEFEKFTDQRKYGKILDIKHSLTRAVEEIERQLPTIKLHNINPFTVRSELRKMLLQVETSTLVRAESEVGSIFSVMSRQHSERSNDEGATQGGSTDSKLQAFNDLKTRLSQLGTSFDSYVSAPRRSFFSSCSLGAGATGLLLATGVDPIIGLSILALICEISRRKFVREVRSLLISYKASFVDTSLECIKGLQTYLFDYIESNKEKNSMEYNKAKEELEVIKKEVKEARALLLRIAPSLEATFPQWRQTPASKRT